MKCQHCVKSVTEALEGLAGVEEVVVDLESGDVSYKNAGVDRQAVRAAILSIGFEPEE